MEQTGTAGVGVKNNLSLIPHCQRTVRAEFTPGYWMLDENVWSHKPVEDPHPSPAAFPYLVDRLWRWNSILRP